MVKKSIGISTSTALLFVVSMEIFGQTDVGVGYSQYLELRNTIESNCYKCFGASEEAFRTAVFELENLVDAGFRPTEARKLLADAKREIAFTYLDRGSSEQSVLLEEHRRAYVDDLMPSNFDSVDILADYVATVPGDSEEIPVLVERLRHRLSTILAEAAFIQGVYLENSSDSAEQRAGLDLLTEAYELAVGLDKMLKGYHLVDSLQASGRAEEAERVLVEIEQYREIDRFREEINR